MNSFPVAFRPLILLSLLVNILPANAQSTLSTVSADSPVVSLDDLIRRALENNPRLPMARENVNASRWRVGAVRSLANPTLQIVTGISGSQEARDEEIVLSQPLDLFGKRRARTSVAKAEMRAAIAESSHAEKRLVVAVKSAAAELFTAQEAERLEQAQVDVAEQFFDAAKRRAQLGDVAPVQAERAELELLRARNELTNAQTNRRLDLSALNLLVGQEPSTPLQVDLSLVPRTDTSLQPNSDFSQWQKRLASNVLLRSDIQGAQATLEARRAQVKVQRREILPEFELQARRSSAFGSGSTALRAVITMPVFDFGSNKRERRALEAEVRVQEFQLSLLKSEAVAEFDQAFVRVQQQRATAERFRTGIVPRTLELLRKTQVGYAQGASSYLEVLDAQRTLRQVQAEYLQALVGAHLAQTQLESSLGSALPNDFPLLGASILNTQQAGGKQ